LDAASSQPLILSEELARDPEVLALLSHYRLQVGQRPLAGAANLFEVSFPEIEACSAGI
jgi:hypothetical protein